MPQNRGAATREKLMAVATDLIRTSGYMATTVDEICAQARVTKGAFFHHFKSKDDLAEACLERWNRGRVAMEAGGAFQKIANPRKRLFAYLDFYMDVFDNPQLIKSCLAGTTVQEVADTHPVLRAAANACFTSAADEFRALLDAACAGSRRRVDTASLAALWLAAIQGSLILSKASQDPGVIRRNLEHVKTYIAAQLATKERKP